MTNAQYVDFCLTGCCCLLPVFDLQSTEQVAAFCRSLHEMNPSECVSSSPSPDSPFPPPATPRQLSDADKLRKVICELVETERTYVKVSIARLGVKEMQMVFISAHVSLLCIDLCALGFFYPLTKAESNISRCPVRYVEITAVQFLPERFIRFTWED